MIPLTFFLVLFICLTNFIFGDFQKLVLEDILPADRKGYDKMRPPRKNGQAQTVSFQVAVLGLDSIDESSMTFETDIFFAQRWKDHRLRMPKNMTTEYRSVGVDWLDHMWRPDSYFRNAKSVTFQMMTVPNHYLWLYKDSTILYMVKLSMELSCAMNFAIYPHDTQICKLEIESLSHTTDFMIFKWYDKVPLMVEKTIQLPKLELIGNITDDCTKNYAGEMYTCLSIVFTLKRRLGYYIFHTYTPSCMIVIISWISFWIKPDAAPARVTLGITSLLTISTQHVKSQSALPPVSYLKAVDAFMSTCTLFVFMALMEYLLVCMVLGDEPPKPVESKSSSENNKDEENIKKTEKKSKIKNDPTGTTSDTDPVIPILTPAQRRLMMAINIDRFSRVTFPFLFIILNLAYWISFYQYL